MQDLNLNPLHCEFARLSTAPQHHRSERHPIIYTYAEEKPVDLPLVSAKIEIEYATQEVSGRKNIRGTKSYQEKILARKGVH